MKLQGLSFKADVYSPPEIHTSLIFQTAQPPLISPSLNKAYPNSSHNIEIQLLNAPGNDKHSDMRRGYRPVCE